ncbi:hypothetical protein D3C80_1434480 [compost metagenome]
MRSARSRRVTASVTMRHAASASGETSSPKMGANLRKACSASKRGRSSSNRARVSISSSGFCSRQVAMKRSASEREADLSPLGLATI